MTKKVTGRYDKRSDKIGIQEWSLFSQGAFEELLKELMREAFEIATEEKYSCVAWFPMEWGVGDGIDEISPYKEPTTIYVELPLGPDEDSNPRWIFTLSDLIESMIDLNEEPGGGPIHEPEAQDAMKAVRDDLRRLANKLDAALNRELVS